MDNGHMFIDLFMYRNCLSIYLFIVIMLFMYVMFMFINFFYLVYFYFIDLYHLFH